MPQVIVTRNTRADGKSIAPDKDGKPQSFALKTCKALVAAGKAKWPKGKAPDEDAGEK